MGCTSIQFCRSENVCASYLSTKEIKHINVEWTDNAISVTASEVSGAEIAKAVAEGAVKGIKGMP